MSTSDLASKSFPQAASRGAGGEQGPFACSSLPPLPLQTSASSSMKVGPQRSAALFVALAEDACARVATRTSIPAGEIVAWPLLDDLRIYPRGATEVLTAPVIELGHGLICPFTAHRVHLSEWSFGLLLLRAGDSGAAESSARPALEIARSNAQVHLLLGLILAQRADTRDEGIEHLKSAARTLPRAQEALKRLQDN